jgi:hypothetical protein
MIAMGVGRRRGALAAVIILAAAMLPIMLATSAAQAGRVKFLDGSDCYHVSPYFKENVKPKLSLYRGSTRVQGPFTIGRFGEYGNAPGRSGIVTPTAPGSYKVKVTCDGIVYTIPISNQFSLPIVDIDVDNRSPRITAIGVYAKIFVTDTTFTKVRRVPPGSLVRFQFTMKDPGAAGAEPDHVVKSTFGTVTLLSREEAGNNEWRITYEWQLPDARGLFDIYVSINDGRGGLVEGSARINAEDGLRLAAIREPAAPAKPSDKAKQLDHFLTMFSTKASTYETLGADSARGACTYYLDLGFASACDGDGMTAAITFKKWKKNWGFDKPANANKQLHAIYVNEVDLGLQRNMNAIRGPNGVAFYVCNHPDSDPQLGDDPDFERPQTGEALVACVAMEYSETPGVNGGRRFTKFLVFDPQGRLARRVNLDGRGIKHIPGACVVCHGATGFSRYPETPGTGNPALGANFLPFDLDNFKFSEHAPFRKEDQQDELRKLNEYVRDRTNPKQAIKDLIDGWYSNPNIPFFSSFVPAGWTGNSAPYLGIVKPACRTCHVAMNTNFNTSENFRAASSIISSYVCGNSGFPEKTRYSMPNARVTFDRFWQSNPSQPQLLRDHLRQSLNDNSLRCDPPQ